MSSPDGPGSSDAAVRTVGLTKNYGDRVALSSLDLAVHRGEVFGFLGPNGAGKTTTIRILLDLLRPTAGEVEVLGQPPRVGGPQLRRRIGYLPGDFVVYEQQTVDQALTGLGRLRGGVARRRLLALADRLELDLHRSVRELSKGNRQKVALVQAFMHEPELLVLDEPTDGLDPLLRQRFLDLVAEVKAEGRTVFLSSHILSEVQACADRVGMVKDGRLVAVDSVQSLRNRAVRRVEISFDDAVTAAAFTHVPGLVDVMVTSEDGRSVLRCHLSGHADELVKAAARYRVETLLVEEPDLEDVFMAMFRTGAP